MAREVELKTIGGIPRSDFCTDFSKDDCHKKQDALWDRVEAQSKPSLEARRVLPGFIALFAVGDGHAVYRVEKTRPLVLQHVPLGDGYRIADAYVRGLVLADLGVQLKGALWLHDRKETEVGR